MDDAYLDLIRSDRVTRRTREVLLERGGAEVVTNASRAGTVDQTAILEAAVDRLIPQQAKSETKSEPVAVARLLLRQRCQGRGDGWRFANMPPDGAALHAGLASLDSSAMSAHGSRFVSLTARQQDQMLSAAQLGQLSWHGLDAGRWFEDLIADAVEIYVSHPGTLARIGFSGIAFLPRWSVSELNATEPWEPVPR
jgi:hypothetical protein